MKNHKLKHTPAPWIFDDIEMKIKGTGDIEGRTVIANVSPKMNYSRGMITQTANAKLMAAAPELLERLNDCIEALKYAAFNYDGRKLESLPDGIIESTGVSDTCLIAVRDALVIIKIATE